MPSKEISDIRYTEDFYNDVKVILITSAYIDQLNKKELKRYMAWINAKYGNEEEEEGDE